jgi:MarR family transcriptional regulator, organic hydroperoxide resistance regulator
MATSVTGKGAAGGPDGAVLAALQQATHVTLHMLAARLAHLGLTGSEQNVLAVLADGQVRAVGELASATGTKASTLTNVLDRLERKGHLERDPDYSDRRSVVVRLTPAGQQAAAAVRAASIALEQSALAGLSRQQLNGFFAVTLALTEASR